MLQTRGRSSTLAVANVVDLPSPVEASHQVPRATPPLTIVLPPEDPSSTAPPSTIAPVEDSLAGASPSPFASSPPEILTKDATPTISLPTSLLSGFRAPPPVASTTSPSFPHGFGFFDTPRSWKRAATINLAAKNKTQFIKGTLPRPRVNHPYRSAWDQCNSMVMAWILQSVPREIVLQSLWDELNEFQPFTPCSCGAMQQIQDHYSRDQILQFLIGLNDSYAGARDQILMFEPLPPLSRIFSMIVQQEHQRSLAPLNAMAAATSSSRPPPSQNNSGNPSRSKKPWPTCSHCLKPRHLVEKCYFLHGFLLAMVTNASKILPSSTRLRLPLLRDKTPLHSCNSANN
uniref:Uncharacterized protein n=1 Tax=Cannabis sativa TaxID=3483 RepID=A0A803NJB0_CANSA